MSKLYQFPIPTPARIETVVIYRGDPLPQGNIHAAWKLHEAEYGPNAFYIMYEPT
jgi:hypothetical protein